MRRERFQQILFDRRYPIISHAHQIDAAAFQLILRLDEVTAIGPQLSFCRRKDTGTCRTGKSAHKCTGLKIITYIFCFVKIRCRYDVGIHLMCLHLLTKQFHSFRYLTHTFCLSFSDFILYIERHKIQSLSGGSQRETGVLPAVSLEDIHRVSRA